MPPKRPLAIAGIQARMSSSRLPGKVLADLAGKPLIQRVYERARASQLVDEVFVLTSIEASDDALAEACSQLCIPVRRGSLADVTARYEALADEYAPRFLVRITGDCPLVEASFIDRQIAALAAFDGDLTRFDFGEEIGGTLGGQTVMSLRAFRLGAQSQDPLDREHVANFFFQRNQQLLRYVATSCDDVYRVPGLRLCVDEAADLALLRAIYSNFSKAGESHFSLPGVIRWLAVHPEVCALNSSVLESAANQEQRKLAPASDAKIVGRWP